jgi:pimeloyl-ACP methyl ester carboxylesterase
VSALVPHLDRDGIAIHYDVDGAGPAMLLSHGFASSSHMFAGNVPALAPDHTVITWDLRGHGGSDYPDDPHAYSAALAVDDMVALLDMVAAERAVLVGHSLGGFLSLALHLAHPDRVAALVLVGTGPGYRRAEGREQWNVMAERFAESFTARGLDGMRGSEELAVGAHRDASGLVHAARGILPQHDDEVLASLPTIKVPTLVVVGSNDSGFLASSEYMAAKIPDATLVVVAGAGHAPNVTHATEFDTHLRAFLDGLEL